MNIKYIKNIFSLVLLSVFLFSCDGKDCIEADDFGEYDTDILTVESKYNLCQWNGNEDSGSSGILECLENGSDNILLDQNCSLELTNDKKYIDLKNCLDGIGDECYSDYSISGSDDYCKSYKDDKGKNKKETLQRAYENALEECINLCLYESFKKENSFETNWESNLFKEEDGTLGIKLIPSQTIDIQVLGSVDLVESLENNIIFNKLLTNKLENGDKYYRENIEPVLSGGWCSEKTNNSCTNWIGEKNKEKENIQKRYEFLRRGVLVLNNLPNGGTLDENGNYSGPDIFIDYNNWKCNYNTVDNSVKCATDYPDSEYKNQNDVNFAMDNNFTKNYGGLAIPVSMSKFILSSPNINNNTSIETSVSLPNSSSKNTYLFRNSIKLNNLYPVKLAFAINDDDENKTCNINIVQEGTTTPYTVSVKANRKWFFPLKDDKQVVFNKTPYNTLKEYFGTNGIDTSETNYSKILVQSENCDKDIFVFVMPQNEILMKKSGFVSFKNLLGDFSDYDIVFDVINPMYDYQSNNDLLSKNFYEYTDTNGKSQSKILTVRKNQWSSEIFVRNGQILRFNSDSWFNISGNNSDGYTITQKSANVDGNTISVGESLVLKTEYRPAVLCKGEAEEEVDNSYCTKIYNIETEKYECAKKTYSDICTTENTDYYCPLGCYCNDSNCSNYKYIDGANTDQRCIYIDGVSKVSCNNCANKIKSDNNNLKTTLKLNLTQCYDLEDYKGAVRNLLDLSNTTLYSTSTSEYGELTNNDKLLKAKKMDTIFNGGNYGNLDGMSIDTSFKDLTTQEFSEFKYNSPASINSKNKSLSFFVIDNSDFDSELKNNYNNNSGEYKFLFTPKENFINGQQLAVVLAMKDWDGNLNSDKFKSWIVKYNSDKSDKNSYGKLDTESPYIFDYNGYMIGNNQNTRGDSKIHLDHLDISLPSDDYDNLRLFFKIIDKPELKQCDSSYTKVVYSDILCKCKSGTNSKDYVSCINLVCDDNVQMETKEQNYCVNSYYNNSGSYAIKIKTPRSVFNSTGYIVKYIMKPILEVLDGKTVALQVDNNGKPIICDSKDSSRCNYYFPESKFDEYETRFGEKCSTDNNNTKEGIICYKNCSNLDLSLYKTNCKYYNNGGGFLQRFYVSVITDRDYQIIVKLCFILMIMFYGMYYLMGMAELTYSELIKRAFKISFIYLMIGTKGWEYYNMFFVKFFKQGMDYLVFAFASAFDNSPDLMNAFTRGDFYDKSVLFSGVDKNLSLLFSDAVSYKIWGLFFVSFFGWLYVFIIYSSILTYIFSVANAMLLYLTAQFFLSILLAMGPIFFVMLIFEKTKEMFNKWINNLISFGLEQILLLTCVSLFNLLVYNVIKFVLSYRVCWKPVWEINVPLLGSLQLMSFWKATTATSATAAASAVPGLFQILLIYLIADLMNKFIEFSTDLGGSLGGSGMYLKDLASDIKKTGQDFYNKRIKEPMKGVVKNLGEKTGRKLIGYKTAEEENKETESSKNARSALRKATRDADAAVSKYKETNSKELIGMDVKERREKIAQVRREAFTDSFKNNGGESALKNLNLTYKDENGKKQKISTAQQVFDNRIVDKDLTVSHSLLGFGIQKGGVRSAVSIHNFGSAVKSGLSKQHNIRTGAFTSAKKVEEDIITGNKDDAKFGYFDRKRAAKFEAQKEINESNAKKTAERSFIINFLNRMNPIKSIKDKIVKSSKAKENRNKLNDDKYNEQSKEEKKLRDTEKKKIKKWQDTEKKKLKEGYGFLERHFGSSSKEYKDKLKKIDNLEGYNPKENKNPQNEKVEKTEQYMGNENNNENENIENNFNNNTRIPVDNNNED